MMTLKTARIINQMTLNEVGQIIGRNAEFISNIEKGSTPSHRDQVILKCVLNCDIAFHNRQNRSKFTVNHNLLRRCRTESHLSLRKVAEKIGVSYQSVLNYETGKKTPSEEVLKKISRLFSVPDDYFLLTDDEIMAEYRKKCAEQDTEITITSLGE